MPTLADTASMIPVYPDISREIYVSAEVTSNTVVSPMCKGISEKRYKQDGISDGRLKR